MPLAVTCQCGARLEIDEKFLGKEILCPDCQRPLPTKPVATPPPLDLPTHRRTSGLAVLSLTCSLVGAFTIVGTFVGIVLGVVALRRIARHPSKYEGAGLARAGIIVGAAGTVMTALLLLFPILGLGVDEYLRWLAYASRTEVPQNGEIKSNAAFGKLNVAIKCQPGWRKYTSPAVVNLVNPPFVADELIAIHIPHDAFIACQKTDIDPLDDNTAQAREDKALECFYKSELVNILGRLGNNAFTGAKGEISEKPDPNNLKEQQFYLDLRLGGQNRRFLIRWKVMGDVRLVVMVGSAPRARFHRVEEDFKKTFDTVDLK